MLNKNKERELAYIVKIDDKEKIPGYDRIVSYRVGGWRCVAGADEFEIGDLAVYIEIDSLCPYNEMFSFLDKNIDEYTGRIRPDRHKIRTQKFAKGQALSQGLIIPLSVCHFSEEKKVGDFVTTELGITYYTVEDNQRKNTSAKVLRDQTNMLVKKWQLKHKWLKKSSWITAIVRWFYYKQLCHGKQYKKNSWPNWVIKTDEERCQNLPYLFPGNPHEEWIATEKIDGTSTTFTMKQDKPRRRKLFVCSRNVVFNQEKTECYYSGSDGNVYLEMARKYNIENILNTILNSHPDYNYITIQGETYGGTIQKRNYGTEHRLAVFNVIYQLKDGTTVRLNPIEMTRFVSEYGLEGVPVVDTHFIIPETCDQLLHLATGVSQIDNGMREGLVFRSYDGSRSFKAVSNEFLIKYHN